MNSFSNYFKKIDVCKDFKEAKSKAKYTDSKYISPCDNGEKGVFAFFKRIPCKLREFGCFISHSFSKSWKLRFITFFIIILYCINLGLIKEGHCNVKDSGDSIFTDSFYLTTTQITTIGYGDVTPQTYVAKIIFSFVHMVVLFLTYSLAEEFGYVTVARSKQTEEIKENVKKDLAPIKVEMTPEIKQTIRNNIIQRMSAPDNRLNFMQTAQIAQSAQQAENNASRFANNLLYRKNAKANNDYPVAGTSYNERRIVPARDSISE